MARVTVEVVKRELVEHVWEPSASGGLKAKEVPGGYRIDTTVVSKVGWGSGFPHQIETLACGHTWRGNVWWRLRSPAPKRYCEECSKQKTEEIKQRKYERILKKYVR